MSVTIYEIQLAFEKRTVEAVRGVPLQIVSTWKEADPNSPKTFMRPKLYPGAVYSEEKGAGGLSRRVGVHKVTFSVPQNTNPQTAINLAFVIEGLYRRQSIYTDSGHRIVCDEPYTTDTGIDEETKRYVLYTDVPWHVFFNDSTL